MSAMNAQVIMVAVLAVTQAEAANSFTFAREQFYGWRAEVTTGIKQQAFGDGREVRPIVDEVSCDVARNGLSIRVDRHGRHDISFGADVDTDGDGEEDESFAIGQVHSLRIGRRTYQAQAVQTLYFPWRFRDVSYPGDPGHDVILPLFSGHLAVRTRPDQPWLHVLTILDELIAAQSVRIGYGEVVDGRVPRISFFDVSLRGLGPALAWCERQIVSDRAYRLQPD
jgi:hypothetical protein